MTQSNWLATLHLANQQRHTRDTVFLVYVELVAALLLPQLAGAFIRSVLGLGAVAGFIRLVETKLGLPVHHPLQDLFFVLGIFRVRPDARTSKVELGMLLRFTKAPAVAAVFVRWEDGLTRISSVVHKEWDLERKAQVVLRGVLPMIFSGCETVHVSLSLKHFPHH